VPGHGDLGRAADVAAFREYLAMLRKLVADARAQGKLDSAVVEAVMPALNAQYGKWDNFKYMAKDNLLEMDAE
jgi:hypothetical protein